MNWAETIVNSLKDSGVSLIAYVPDISIHQVTRLMEEDDYFHVVSATREEEAIGIATGAYATGRNAAVFMQSSGFGNCVNALASLCLPARVPLPMFINLRGEPWVGRPGRSWTRLEFRSIPWTPMIGSISASLAPLDSATHQGNRSLFA